MRQSRPVLWLRFAPWAVAGVLLLGAGASATAQDAPTAPIATDSETTVTPVEMPAAASSGAGDSAAPSAMPSAGVGLASGGTAPYSLGALVGAGVAAIFALRERLKGR